MHYNDAGAIESMPVLTGRMFGVEGAKIAQVLKKLAEADELSTPFAGNSSKV